MDMISETFIYQIIMAAVNLCFFQKSMRLILILSNHT